MPTLKNILKLRNYDEDKIPDAYIYFVDNFLECVAGKRLWKKDKTSRLLSSAVQVSDKAFALLLLENHWDGWLEQLNPGEDEKTNVPAKYTVKQGTRKFEGWSQEGYKRYNELYEMVAADRLSANGKHFEEEFLRCAKERADHEEETARMNNKTPRRPPVKARNDLFSSNSEESDSGSIAGSDYEF